MDEEEFEVFFRAYYLPVLRYCITIVKDEDDALDIIQQTFLNIWQKRNEIKIQTTLKAYMYKMVYNASLDHLKHLKVRLNYVNNITVCEEKTAFTDSVVENQLNLKIIEAIEALPEQCKKIFKMNRMEQLKYKEIAKKLNLSNKTVENQMGKALKLLRQSLKSYLAMLWLMIFLIN